MNNYFKFQHWPELSLMCVFDKWGLTHMIALRIKESCVWNLAFETILDAVMTPTFPKQVGYRWKKIIHIYFGYRNRLEKDYLSPVLSNFHRKDRNFFKQSTSMSDSEFSIIFLNCLLYWWKNCKPIFISLRCLISSWLEWKCAHWRWGDI